nr:hypothetical protein BaRGS_026278 [Batillaria attramentaria]
MQSGQAQGTMRATTVPWILALVSVGLSELLQNGGFESLAHWDCWQIQCTVTTNKHSGQHGVEVRGRQESWQGPSQYIHVVSGHTYHVSGYIKLLNDQAGHQGQNVSMMFDDGSTSQVSMMFDDGSTSQVDPPDVEVIRRKVIIVSQVVQKKKSFPFGMMAKAPDYNANAANGKYRDFIHKHFNWAVTGNALKWYAIEPRRSVRTVQETRIIPNKIVVACSIKVRGHNLVWSVDKYVQDWIKQLHGDELRNVVKHHIEETMNVTRGLLEHWDVNNENLHGHWYQNQLHDPDYNLELFRIAHHADPNVKLFLNDYNVVAGGGSTDERLDKLAQAGLPIWATELDCVAGDENTRADYYEKALRSLYGHPAVDGILFWGFWDRNHWRGPTASIATGDDVVPNAAGRRVLDLLENQWMTDETHVLSQSGNQFTVRGFHGDYEVHVMYQGHELGNLKKSFTLGKGAHTVNLNVHT